MTETKSNVDHLDLKGLTPIKSAIKNRREQTLIVYGGFDCKVNSEIFIEEFGYLFIVASVYVEHNFVGRPAKTTIELLRVDNLNTVLD